MQGEILKIFARVVRARRSKVFDLDVYTRRKPATAKAPAATAPGSWREPAPVAEAELEAGAGAEDWLLGTATAVLLALMSAVELGARLKLALEE